MRITLLLLFTASFTANGGIFDILRCCPQSSKKPRVTVDYYDNLGFTANEPLPAFDIDAIIGALHAPDFTKVVQEVKGHSGNLNQVSTGGELPLVVATRIGHAALVRLLYEAGAKPMAQDTAGESAEKIAQKKADATNQVQFACHSDLQSAQEKLATAWKKIAPSEAGYLEEEEAEETAPIVVNCGCGCNLKTHRPNKLLTLPCTHKIHKTCRLELIKSGKAQCPQCREKFKLSQKEITVKRTAEKLTLLQTQRETFIKGEIESWLDMGLTDRATAILLAGDERLLPPEEENEQQYE